HSPSDASSYRTPEEIEAWVNEDVLKSFSAKLIDAKIATKEEFDAIHADVPFPVLWFPR
ncbi:MAG: hypothetical protein II369_05355, partial [Clostridia bacterium]|nr:hypothetical protein [Clostridia bacterium]